MVLSFFTALIIKTVSENTAAAGADIVQTRGSFIRRVREKIKTKLSKVGKSVEIIAHLLIYLLTII